MALHDLKKKPQASKPKPLCDVDSFIEQAELYANGYQNVVQLPLKQSRQAQTVKAKNATFSLNQQVINELEQIKQQTGLSKSLLVRSLTHYLNDLAANQQRDLLDKYLK
ncbi:hypothetical protein [Agarivorans sp.]|uniref:hypothetical protein n=1 Tax=Agarivorans sp. TaxID=1872412 RepID=UPI003CFF9E23